MDKNCYNNYMGSRFGDLLRILSRFEKNLDNEEFDSSLFKDIKISKIRFRNYIEMLEEAGYIEGVEIREYINDEVSIDFDNARITIDGLKFLTENSMIAKTYKVVKEAAGVIKP